MLEASGSCRSTGQTDGRRTPDRYMDPAPHTVHAGSVRTANDAHLNVDICVGFLLRAASRNDSAEHGVQPTQVGNSEDVHSG